MQFLASTSSSNFLQHECAEANKLKKGIAECGKARFH
jgi:hypothetical protein